MIDPLMAGKRGERELLGPDGVLGELTRRLVERTLSEELTEHLGYPVGRRLQAARGTRVTPPPPKAVLTDDGPVPLELPRDRDSEFEP